MATPAFILEIINRSLQHIKLSGMLSDNFRITLESVFARYLPNAMVSLNTTCNEG